MNALANRVLADASITPVHQIHGTAGVYEPGPYGQGPAILFARSLRGSRVLRRKRYNSFSIRSNIDDTDMIIDVDTIKRTRMHEIKIFPRKTKGDNSARGFNGIAGSSSRHDIIDG